MLALVTCDMWQVTHCMWHLKPDTGLKRKEKRIFFWSIGALTHTRQEIQFQPPNESRITKETNIHNFKTNKKTHLLLNPTLKTVPIS